MIFGRRLTSAYVAHLTYFRSFEPEAESQCENYLNIALQLDSASPEALQALASVRISQNRHEEAQELVQKAWQLWREASEGIL